MRDAVLHLFLHLVVSGITTKRDVTHNCTAIKHHLSFLVCDDIFCSNTTVFTQRLRVALVRWGGVVGGWAKLKLDNLIAT